MDALNVARWEWFKLRHRWLPWILLGILLLFSQLVIWGNLNSYRSLKNSGGEVVYRLPTALGRGGRITLDCRQLQAGQLPPALQNVDQTIVDALTRNCLLVQTRQQSQQLDRYDNFTLPGSLRATFSSALAFGLILLTVLTASVIGSEYGYGTLRPMLSLGTGRGQVLAGKLIMIVAAGVSALLIMAGVVVLSSLAAQALEPTAPAGLLRPDMSEVLSTIGRTAFSLLAYTAMTALVTVLTRSSAMGMAVGLGYYFAEQVAAALLTTFFSWFSQVQAYLLGHQISAWASSRLLFSGGDQPSDVHAILVLSVYLLLSGLLAFVIFQRRDVSGPNGGG